MPSLYNPSPSSSTPTIPYVQATVCMAENWGDDWQGPLPYLEVLECELTTSHSMGKAVLRYQMGNIKREDQNSDDQYTPQDLRGMYVQISFQTGNDDPVVAFTGFVEESAPTYIQQDIPAGEQRFIAYPVEHILERLQIYKTFALKKVPNTSASNANDDDIDTDDTDDSEGDEDGGGGDDQGGNDDTGPGNQTDATTTTQLHWVVPFNRRPTKGYEIEGNRSAAKGPDGVYCFSEDAHTWSNLQIMLYLLQYMTPTFMQWQITGQTDTLDQTFRYWHFDKMNVWQAIQHLIDHKKGLTCVVQVQQDWTINIVVYSTTDVPVQVGGITVPANQNQTSLDMPQQNPQNQLVEDLPLRVTDTNTFGKIVVEGARIRMTCPYGFQATELFANDILFNGCTADMQSLYDNANDITDDPDAADRYRADDRFADVYQKFVVDFNWDGTVSGCNGNVMPIPKNDGTVSLDLADLPKGETAPSYWLFDKQFDRNLPFKNAVDYSQDPPTDDNPSSAVAQYRPMMLLYYDHDNSEEDGDSDPLDAPSHAFDDKWHYVEHLGQDDDDLKNLNLHRADKQLGFFVHGHPNHYLAANHFAGDPSTTNTVPELDYENFMLVAQMETDQRPFVSWKNTIDNGRIRVETVNACRYIYAVPSCPIGIDEDGALIQLPDDIISVFDDDSDTLKSILAQMVAFYGVERQAVELTVNQPGLWVTPGQLITAINTAYSTESIRTLVTSVKLDFLHQKTIIKTGFADLDFTKLAGRAEDLDSGGDMAWD